MTRITTTARLASAVIVLVTVAAACTGGAPVPARTTAISASATGSAASTEVKIAVFEDFSIEDPTHLVSPAYLGLQLALNEAAQSPGGLPVQPEMVALDVQGDPARAAQLAQSVIADPSYVAAVILPFWAETTQVGSMLQTAGIPTLSISPLGPDLGQQGWAGWRRMVPTQPRQADSLAALLEGAANRRSGVCIARIATPYSAALSGLLRDRLGKLVVRTVTIASAGQDAYGQAVAEISAAGCPTLAWTGYSASGALLRTSLTDAGLPGVTLYGADGIKDEPFLTYTGGAGDGTVATCACADLSTSADREAQRFIHDYQSSYGSPPGVYGVEGWDAGGLLVRAFLGGATDRPKMMASLSDRAPYQGLAGAYAWTPTGELTQDSVRVGAFEDRAQRWVPLGGDGTAAAVSLPLHTQGLLTAATCRPGLPFAGETAARPRGFEVDLASAMARRLGVRLAWSELPCAKARQALAAGRLDMLFAPKASLPQGTPTSRVVLSVRTALVARRRDVQGGGPKLGAGDVVGVVAGRVTSPWARSVLKPTGASLRTYTDPAAAYAALERGQVAAVADTEPGAWAAIEHRPDLAVARTADAGAHDVIVAAGPGTVLLGALDGAVAGLLDSGRYALLWTKWLPGSTVPTEVGQ